MYPVSVGYICCDFAKDKDVSAYYVFDYKGKIQMGTNIANAKFECAENYWLIYDSSRDSFVHYDQVVPRGYVLDLAFSPTAVILHDTVLDNLIATLDENAECVSQELFDFLMKRDLSAIFLVRVTWSGVYPNQTYTVNHQVYCPFLKWGE